MQSEGVSCIYPNLNILNPYSKTDHKNVEEEDVRGVESNEVGSQKAHQLKERKTNVRAINCQSQTATRLTDHSTQSVK